MRFPYRKQPNFLNPSPTLDSGSGRALGDIWRYNGRQDHKRTPCHCRGTGWRASPRPTDLEAAIREGFPQTVVEEVMHAAGLTLKQLATSLDLSPRSLQRRRREGRLARYESDRLYRLARIVALAKHYLGDDERATRWLRRPNRALGGRTPLQLMDTELGARAVENVLGRIAYGGVS